MKRRACSHSSDENLFVLDPANHIHIDHGHGFVERQRRVFHPLGRTEQTKFFSRKRSEENSALELALAWREQARQFHHAGGAGSIVVRARMNLANL